MSTSYDNAIKKLELQVQLESQQAALTRVDLELMRMKKKAEEYEATKVSLNDEIAHTKAELNSLKGGDNNG